MHFFGCERITPLYPKLPLDDYAPPFKARVLIIFKRLLTFIYIRRGFINVPMPTKTRYSSRRNCHREIRTAKLFLQ